MAKSDIGRYFNSRQVTNEQEIAIDLFRADFIHLAEKIDHYDNCREKSIALRKLEEAAFYVNKMVAFSK